MDGGRCVFELHISVSLAGAEQFLCSAELSPTALTPNSPDSCKDENQLPVKWGVAPGIQQNADTHF